MVLGHVSKIQDSWPWVRVSSSQSEQPQEAHPGWTCPPDHDWDWGCLVLVAFPSSLSLPSSGITAFEGREIQKLRHLGLLALASSGALPHDNDDTGDCPRATHSGRAATIYRSLKLLYHPHKTDKGKLFVSSHFTDGKREATLAHVTGSGNPPGNAIGKLHLAYLSPALRGRSPQLCPPAWSPLGSLAKQNLHVPRTCYLLLALPSSLLPLLFHSRSLTSRM